MLRYELLKKFIVCLEFIPEEFFIEYDDYASLFLAKE